MYSENKEQLYMRSHTKVPRLRYEGCVIKYARTTKLGIQWRKTAKDRGQMGKNIFRGLILIKADTQSKEKLPINSKSTK